MVSPVNRLRPHPEVRFARNKQAFDLDQAVLDLLKENSGRDQHRQVALFRHGAMTVALYHFERGSRLPQHVVDGEVIFHVLSGRITIVADDDGQKLSAGMLYTLSRAVGHDISADEISDVLMTVNLAGNGSHVLEESEIGQR